MENYYYPKKLFFLIEFIIKFIIGHYITLWMRIIIATTITTGYVKVLITDFTLFLFILISFIIKIHNSLASFFFI